ncbi:MAG: ferrochelatase [Proteobacteria bacterium]|nr:ferrochelatase [Pseudomonadota bacterium]
MVWNLDDTLQVLAHADAKLEAAVGEPGSLAPDRRRASLLSELSDALLRDQPAPILEAFGTGLASIARAQLCSFPGNLFWDFDFLAASLLFEAQRSPRPALQLRELCSMIVSLQDLFGQGTSVRFQYAHDFLYGFDWARWVRTEPRARAGCGPLSRPFLAALLQRGEQLLELIAKNDPKYPRLAGDVPRNPFAFSRTPHDEERLMRHLAKHALIPVQAWNPRARPIWNLPFSQLRERQAQALGLVR